MLLSPQWLDALRARLSLSTVIGRTTRLTRAGSEFKACCPFHEEKTPSFTVSDAKGFYHCFGCGAHGDVIRWMTDQRGLSFIDAVRELASEAGMDLPAADPVAARQAERRHGLHDVLAAAQAWFVANLQGPGGQAAREYLTRRGFSAEILARFGFGYAPADRQALRAGLREFAEPLLIEAGLRIAAEGREPYDRFRDRIMLPIRDRRGRVVGFGGRVLDTAASDTPKYLNSPDTPLFDKGRTLYNLDRAGPLARKGATLAVVEGYLDVVALAAGGIDEAVAPLGTALTESQIELLWQACPTPVLCFDGDPAGRRAAIRAMVRALPLLRPGHSLGIVRLPSGLDPDDLVRQRGGAAMGALIAQAQPLVDALWDEERDAHALLTPEARAGLKSRLLAHVETIREPDIRALYRRDLLDRFSAWAFPRSPPRRRRPGGPYPTGPYPALAPAPPSQPALGRDRQGARSLQAAVLRGLVQFPDVLDRFADTLARARFGEPGYARLFDVLIDFADSGVALEAASLATILAERQAAPPHPSEYASLHFPFLQRDIDPARARENLGGAIALLVERPAIDAAIAEATGNFAVDPDGAMAEITRLRERKLALHKSMMQSASARASAEHEVNE